MLGINGCWLLRLAEQARIIGQLYCSLDMTYNSISYLAQI